MIGQRCWPCWTCTMISSFARAPVNMESASLLAGRVGTCGGRVEARHGRGAGEALVEAEAVVDVVDVAARDAEVALNLRRRERERICHLVQARGHMSPAHILAGLGEGWRERCGSCMP